MFVDRERSLVLFAINILILAVMALNSCSDRSHSPDEKRLKNRVRDSKIEDCKDRDGRFACPL